MKIAVVPGITFCLLFSFQSCHMAVYSEDREEYHRAMVGPASPPLKLALSICAMKTDAGPCKALHSRYHFNMQTQHCELFDYGGCEGNANNFLTLEECQAMCIVPVADLPGKKKRARFKKEKPSFCLLENDPGICRGLISRYFYNKESQQCEKFMYGGCLGNQNNFESLKECQDICQNSPNSLQTEDEERALPGVANNISLAVKQALVPSFCISPMDRGLCRANEKRFFYNHMTGKCHPFSYSGCGGNVNNFTSRKSCLQMCKKGFVKKKKGQRGIMKIRRKRKKQPGKLTDEEIVIERL